VAAFLLGTITILTPVEPSPMASTRIAAGIATDGGERAGPRRE